MYRQPAQYERMVDLAIDVILDYNITAYPLDVDDLIKKMKINLVPYSAYPDYKDLFLKRSKDAFFIPRSNKMETTIFFNDIYGGHLTPARIKSSKAHELKHILENDIDDSEDDLCEYFSKYIRCPIPIVMYLNITTEVELISAFQISYEQAGYILKNIKTRKSKYGNGYFKKEVVLLQQIFGDYLDVNRLHIIEK